MITREEFVELYIEVVDKTDFTEEQLATAAEADNQAYLAYIAENF